MLGNESGSLVLSGNNAILDLCVDNNKFVYVANGSGQDIIKLNSMFDVIWTFTGHTGTVNGVAVDQNGYVYSGSQDNTVRKIDPDGNQVWSFTGHGGAVYSVAVDSMVSYIVLVEIIPLEK